MIKVNHLSASLDHNLFWLQLKLRTRKQVWQYWMIKYILVKLYLINAQKSDLWLQLTEVIVNTGANCTGSIVLPPFSLFKSSILEFRRSCRKSLCKKAEILDSKIEGYIVKVIKLVGRWSLFYQVVVGLPITARKSHLQPSCPICATATYAIVCPLLYTWNSPFKWPNSFLWTCALVSLLTCERNAINLCSVFGITFKQKIWFSGKENGQLLNKCQHLHRQCRK